MTNRRIQLGRKTAHHPLGPHCLIPAPKHVIFDKDENGEYTTKLFAKEPSYKSMLKILGY